MQATSRPEQERDGDTAVHAPPLVFISPTRRDVETICELVDAGAVVALAPSVSALHDAGLAARPSVARATVTAGDVRVEVEHRRAFVRGVPLSLTNLELGVLTLLARLDGRPASYADLSSAVWETPFLGSADHIHCAVKRLRAKLRAARSTTAIDAVRGFGYRVSTCPPDGDRGARRSSTTVHAGDDGATSPIDRISPGSRP